MKLSYILVGSMLACASFLAQATTITFESSGTLDGVNDLNYPIGGFVFNPTMDNIDVGAGSPYSQSGPAHSGRFAAINNQNGDGEITMANGGTFSFQDLWLKSWLVASIPVTVSGWLNGVQVGAISGDMTSWGWTNFTGNFANIDMLQIAVPYANFLVDDIRVSPNVSAVPEPRSYAMLLVGLGLAAWTARRRRRGAAPAVPRR